MAGDVGKVYYAFSDQEILFDGWYIHFAIVLDAIWFISYWILPQKLRRRISENLLRLISQKKAASHMFLSMMRCISVMLLIPKILLFFLKYIFNQLPRLSGRWVPGIPRGFRCGQIKNCPHGWQIPLTQPWAPIPGTCHTDETVEGRKIGMGVGGRR